jgi:hypothetical protein
MAGHILPDFILIQAKTKLTEMIIVAKQKMQYHAGAPELYSLQMINGRCQPAHITPLIMAVRVNEVNFIISGTRKPRQPISSPAAHRQPNETLPTELIA